MTEVRELAQLARSGDESARASLQLLLPSCMQITEAGWQLLATPATGWVGVPSLIPELLSQMITQDWLAFWQTMRKLERTYLHLERDVRKSVLSRNYYLALRCGTLDLAFVTVPGEHDDTLSIFTAYRLTGVQSVELRDTLLRQHICQVNS